jgi:P4 family phage/plasmid primase-like protien
MSFSEAEIAKVKDGVDLVAVVSSLVDAPVKRSGAGRFVTFCPFHEEKTPSFTLTPSKGLMKCFGCDWSGDVVQFVQERKGLDFPGAMRFLGAQEDVSSEGKGKASSAKKIPRSPRREGNLEVVKRPERVDSGAVADPRAKPYVPTGSKLVCFYDYHRPDGSVAHQKLRLDPKDFRQRRPVSKEDRVEWDRLRAAGKEAPFEQEGWVYSLAGARLYPYRLVELMEADMEMPVFFCEGEKDADSLGSLGLVATTFTDKNFLEEYAEFFRGRWVVMVEDFDGLKKSGEGMVRPGEIHAKRMGREFLKIAERVSWLRMPELWKGCAEGTDITDFVERGRESFSPDEVMAAEIVAAAEQGEPPLEVLYEGIYEEGDRGGIVLLEDVLANRIVQHRRLLSAGGEFWQWRVPGMEDGGTWRSMPVGAAVHGWIREVLRQDRKTLKLIESRRLNSLVNVMTSSRFAHPNEFNDHDPLLINCRSGMLHALTGDLLPHNPRYLSTTQVPVPWNEEAKCPTWMEVLERLQPDAEVRSQIQEMFGYCLVPAVNYHVFFFLYGDGGTGKSTCADLLTALVGEANTIALQLEELDNGFTRSQLVGKQLYLAGELTSRSFRHIGLLKQIVAGEPIFVDVKNRPGFMYRPKGRFVMTSNVHAATPDTSGGFERRFLQIDWKHVIPEGERDYELAKKLMAELPGVFRWAVEGYQRLHERGHFAHTQASREATRELMRHRSSVKEFLNDTGWMEFFPPNQQMDDRGDELWVTTEEIYDHYREWCDYHGVNAYYETANTFCKEGYQRRGDLMGRRTRRGTGAGRAVGFWGLRRKWPEGWGPGVLD